MPYRGSKGRPTLMTAATVDKVLGHLRDGLFRDTTEALCGLGRGTLESWIARGRKDLEKAEAALQLRGEMPTNLSKWAKFVLAVEAAEAHSEAEDWGTVNEVQRARGPSPGLDEHGRPIPGPLLHPALALDAAKYKRSRKNNLRYGAGSQRTDITRAGGEGESGSGEDDAATVMEILDRRIEKKMVERDSGERDQ